MFHGERATGPTPEPQIKPPVVPSTKSGEAPASQPPGFIQTVREVWRDAPPLGFVSVVIDYFRHTGEFAREEQPRPDSTLK